MATNIISGDYFNSTSFTGSGNVLVGNINYQSIAPSTNNTLIITGNSTGALVYGNFSTNNIALGMSGLSGPAFGLAKNVLFLANSSSFPTISLTGGLGLYTDGNNLYTTNSQGIRTVNGWTGANYGDYLYWNGTGAFVVGDTSVTLGNSAGQFNPGTQIVAIGNLAGTTGSNPFSVSVGSNAGQYFMGTGSVAVGYFAGNLNMGQNVTAVGSGAGANNCGSKAVAIGATAGQNNQGTGSISIGYGATATAINSIVLDALGGVTAGNVNNAFYVAQPRVFTDAGVTSTLNFNPTTYEVTASPVSYFYSYDTTSQAYTGAQPVFQNISFNHNGSISFGGWAVVGTTGATCPSTGAYRMSFSGVCKSSANSVIITIRVIRNSVEIPGSAIAYDPGTNPTTFSQEFLATLVTNDIIGLQFSSNTTSINNSLISSGGAIAPISISFNITKLV